MRITWRGNFPCRFHCLLPVGPPQFRCWSSKVPSSRLPPGCGRCRARSTLQRPARRKAHPCRRRLAARRCGRRGRGRSAIDEEPEPVAGSSSDVPAEWLRTSRRRLESSAEQIALRTRARGDPRWRGAQASEAEIRAALSHARDTDLLAFSLGQQERSDVSDTAVQTLSFARGNLSMKSVHWAPHHSGLVILGCPVQVVRAGGGYNRVLDREPVAPGEPRRRSGRPACHSCQREACVSGEPVAPLCKDTFACNPSPLSQSVHVCWREKKEQVMVLTHEKAQLTESMPYFFLSVGAAQGEHLLRPLVKAAAGDAGDELRVRLVQGHRALGCRPPRPGAAPFQTLLPTPVRCTACERGGTHMRLDASQSLLVRGIPKVGGEPVGPCATMLASVRGACRPLPS